VVSRVGVGRSEESFIGGGGGTTWLVCRRGAMPTFALLAFNLAGVVLVSLSLL
jgi:hypothetical protein